MSTWKTKLCGDNVMNFWGWVVASLVTLGASVVALLVALKIGLHSATDMLLLAIYLMVMGHFCLAQQNYFARVSEKIDTARKDEQK